MGGAGLEEWVGFGREFVKGGTGTGGEGMGGTGGRTDLKNDTE